MECCGPNVPVSMLVLRDACSSPLTELIRRELLGLSSTWVAGSSSNSLFGARSCLPICSDHAQQLEFIRCFWNRGNNQLMHRFSSLRLPIRSICNRSRIFCLCHRTLLYNSLLLSPPPISDQDVRKWPAKSNPLKDEPSKAKSIRLNRPRQRLASMRVPENLSGTYLPSAATSLKFVAFGRQRSALAGHNG